MDGSYKRLLKSNEAWAKARIKEDPAYFTKHAQSQSPPFLWIGCSDSRVAASEITDTHPGEIFEHRNIANMVVSTDLNFLSVLQYAVDVLQVTHVIVCGHYGCGGVAAAMSAKVGPINLWLSNIKEVYARHQDELLKIEDEAMRAKRLVEFNIAEQVKNLAKTDIMQRAWQERPVYIHGWVYDLEKGRLRDLGEIVQSTDELEPIFRFEEYHDSSADSDE